MLKESFLGHRPTHFAINPIIKYFILSETFVWSAMNFIMPIFAVFAATRVVGGSVSVAATGFSVYLVARVIFELIIGELAVKYSDKKKIKLIVLGTSLITISYIGFAFTTTVFPIYFFYAIKGIGLGVSTPIKNAFFSTHLDKKRETSEWGIHDAAVFLGMAFSAAIGGLIADNYGFSVVFFLAAGVNALGILPYFIIKPKLFKNPQS